MIKGQTVTLYERTEGASDAFGAPVIAEVPVEIPGVLVGEPTADDIVTATQVYGKTASYMLGIPKGDTHAWEDCRVEWTDPAGRTVSARTFGFTIYGVEANVPGAWHGKIKAERYGG